MCKYNAVSRLFNFHVSNILYTTCIGRKQTKKKVPKNSHHMSKSIFEFTYFDLWDSLRIKSLRRAHYYVISIDNFSKKIWAYFIEHKSYMLLRFKIYEEKIKALTNRLIQVLKINNYHGHTQVS